jgi:hypothetical protein
MLLLSRFGRLRVRSCGHPLQAKNLTGCLCKLVTGMFCTSAPVSQTLRVVKRSSSSRAQAIPFLVAPFQNTPFNCGVRQVRLTSRPSGRAKICAPLNSSVRRLVMSAIEKYSKSPATYFAVCVAIYAVGVYMLFAYLCQPAGPWTMLAAIVIGAIGCIVLGISAFRRRSIWRTLGTVISTLVLAVLFFLVGVLALSGCSGV